MSFTGIRDGLYTTLTSCGPYSAAEISTCDFGILEGVSVCGIVFTPGQNTTVEPDRFGATINQRGYQRNWSIAGRTYIKDTGDSSCMLARVWQAHDDLYDTVRKDDSLNSSACEARVTRFAYNPDISAEWAGQFYSFVEWEIIAAEY